MDAADQITLHDLIIHKVDHINQTKPRLSELKSPISEAVDLYVREQIVLNREHEFSRDGLFRPPPKDKPDMKQLCDDLLASDARFVPQSQAIAEHLFASINNDGRIRPGDLVVCTFSETKSEKSLALLKMDPQDSFITDEETFKGKRRLVLKQVRDVMPIGALQKCAFILPAALRTKRQDLIVLDQQQARYGVSHVVASFFSKDFLQCRVGLNDREATQAFLSASAAWIDSRKDAWEPADIDTFRENLQLSLQKKTVSIATFANTLIEEESEREDFLEKVFQSMTAQGFRDKVFKPSAKALSRTQVLVIEGDNGLRVRINSDAVGLDKTLNYEYDQATALWTILIRTMKMKKDYK